MELVRTTLFLPRRYHELLKRLAHEKGTSMAKLVHKALEQAFFKRKKKTARDLLGSVKNTHISEGEFKKIKSGSNLP